MSTIVTRSGKGSPLTHNEVDENFTNLNSDKTENSAAAITGGSINNTVIGNTTPNAATFTTLTATGQTNLGGDASNPSFRANTVSGPTRWVEASGSVNGDPVLSTWSTGAAAGLVFTTRGASNFRFTTAASSANEQFRVSHTASAVNFVQVTGAATGGQPAISAQGSDTDINMNFASKNAGALIFNTNGRENFRVANGGTSVVNNIQVVGAAATFSPAIQARGTDTNIGLNLTTKGTGEINLQTGSGTQFRVIDRGSPVNFWSVGGAGTGVSARLYADGSDGSVFGTIGVKGSGNINFTTGGTGAYSGGVTQFQVNHTASAVNFVQVTGAATGGTPVISMQGSDANIGAVYRSKGTGAHIFQNSNGNWLLRVANPTGTLVNYPMASASVSGSPSGFQVEGSDTNIDLALTPKGTGRVQFGTYTATISAITGYIEIKDAGGTVRRLAVVA